MKTLFLPKVIFFDLDDTLTSFDSVSATAWDISCEAFISTKNPSFSKSNLLESIQKAKKWYWKDSEQNKWGREHLQAARREVVRLALEELGHTALTDSHELADHYMNLQDSLIAPLPGVQEALQTLKDMKIRMSVITNGRSDTQREKLDRFHLTDFFEKIIIDTEVGFSKPDIRIYEFALNEMKISANESWMVGDNLNWDIYGAQNAGLFAVWIEGLAKSSEIQPDLTVPSIAQMTEIIKKL